MVTMTEDRAVDYVSPLKDRLGRLLVEIRAVDVKRAEAERLAAALVALGQEAPELPWKVTKATGTRATPKFRHWTPEEDAIVIEQAKLGRVASEIARLLPGREPRAIGVRMAQLRRTGLLRDGMNDPVEAAA